MTNPEMKLPTINSVITKGTNEYPSFSKMNAQGNQVNIGYNEQGTNFQNQPLPQGTNSSAIDSYNPMLDVAYDSEKTKNYNQPNQNVPLQQNYNQPNQNVPLQQNYNQPNQNVPLQQNYNQPIPNVSLDNSSIGVRQSEIYDQQYCSEKTKYGQTNQYNNQNINYGNNNLDREYTSTGRNQIGQPINYDYVPPNRPKMYPHFPHHPHHGPFPHFPHYPASGYPYQYGYA